MSTMTTETYSLAQVLEVAKIHPFYNPDVEYPPDPETIQEVLRSAAKEPIEPDITLKTLISKKDLYNVIGRLTDDTNPQNTYRHSSYISITGGGSGGIPLMFVTDSLENRRHRARFGAFLKTCKVVEPRDWILTTHASGYFYRSLDLLSEILEMGGATVMSAGNLMTPQEVIRALAHYHVNVLTGDGSQVIQVIHHISTLPAEERKKIKLNKIIYTSEPLSEIQRNYITETLGPVKIFSILGSAEAGPYAIGNPDLTGEHGPPGTVDFIFDTRTVVNEILHPSILDSGDLSSGGRSVPDGEQGIIVQTSLQRLRNPLVRYITGDLGSLHPVPQTSQIPEAELKHFRVLRLQGRDRRFSFKWFGMYFEFENITKMMRSEGSGVLQWQVILDRLDSSPQTTVEIRMLRSAGDHNLSTEAMVKLLETFFFILPENQHLFRITFLDSLRGFEKSSTGNKVMNFVDRVH